jgi:two-component system, cell cycle sensor histidine kinase and response regulator CckA
LGALLSRVVAESTQAVVIFGTGVDRRRILHVNRTFEQMTGYERASAAGNRLSDLLRPPGGQIEWERVEAAMLGGNSWRKALPASRRDGTVFWADVHLYPITPPTHDAQHWVGVINDVTDHLELHEALRQSEARHRFLAENIRDLITVCRADGICTYASASGQTLLGYEPEELMGRLWTDFIHPEDHANVRATLEGHFQGRLESVLVHRMRRKDGAYVWTETTSKTRRDPGSGQASEVVSTTRDISKRRMAEDSLKAMHTLLDSVYEAVPLGLCLLDQSGRINQCNRSFGRLFGLAPMEVSGRLADSLLPGRELARARVAQGTPCECECSSAQGETFPAELTVVSLDAGASQLVIVADLRERKKMESRLHEASQLESLGTLAGGIAHDFNNMLAIVLGYASLLRDAAGDPARLAHYADTIIDAGRRGADVVRQLQLFANTQDAELANTDLHALLEETITRTSNDWPASIKIVRSFNAGDATLIIDPIQFGQAIQKLLENAREAMPEGGTLTVRTSEVRQSVFAPGASTAESKYYLRVSVQDNGHGMDAATRARMFEPFFARNKSPEVRGLGLAVVYGIMRAHRGLIEVDSAPGEGTSVHLLLPRATEVVEATPAPAPEPFTSTTSRRTILLVEDEQDIGTLWLELLPTEGWRVLWARDGAEAVRLFRAHRDEIALVFTDIGLPNLDGWQVAAAVRAEMPGLPFLIASGAFRPGDRQRGLAEPVAYLSKPYVPSKVLKQIRALLPAQP